jgi:hypothetical protein
MWAGEDIIPEMEELYGEMDWDFIQKARCAITKLVTLIDTLLLWYRPYVIP